MKEEEEEEEEERPRSLLWQVFGHQVPRSEIVFICQIVLVYTVVIVALYNLTTRGGEEGEDRLWTALLASCLGYLLPNPSLNQRK